MQERIIIDIEKCVGCGACVVTCMDQNDIYPENGQPPFRRIYQSESEEVSKDSPLIRFASLGCRHCTDSPCLTGCPTGAIYRDPASQAILVAEERCIGCHSCALACPFGVPRYDSKDHMQKCNLCSGRLEAGLQPACVKVCPYGALSLDNPNCAQGAKETAYIKKLLDAPITLRANE